MLKTFWGHKVVKSGKSSLLLLYNNCHSYIMSFLTGEFECKLDPKSRMMVPSGLKKKLPEIDIEGFHINRGFGAKKHLVIYPNKEWNKKLEELSKLNEYDEDNEAVIEYFLRGSTHLTPDAAGRVLLPKFLLDYAGIKNEVVLSLQLNKIKVWSADSYQEVINNEPENFAPIIKRVFGTKEGRNDG
jgi:MraZ protein